MTNLIDEIQCPICGSFDLCLDNSLEGGFYIICPDCRYIEPFKFGPYREDRNDSHSFTCTQKTTD